MLHQPKIAGQAGIFPQGTNGITVGRHSTAGHTAQRVSYFGSLAVAFGIGAAIAGGIGTAHAEGPADGGKPGTSAPSSDSHADTGSAASDSAKSGGPGSATHESGGLSEPDDGSATIGGSPQSLPALIDRVSDRLTTTLSRAKQASAATPDGEDEHRTGTGRKPASVADRAATAEAETTTAADTGDAPAPIQPSATGASSVPNLANDDPAVSTDTPSPDDEMPTAYGDIGKWMLKAGGQIANWGSKLYDGKTLLEAVNVIIVDPHPTSRGQAAHRLNQAMFWSGFPAQPLHSFGFRGSIDDVTYGQQPSGLLLSYSNNFFLLRNDHGRIFGPDPVETDTGYVWSGSFSTEEVGFSGGVPGHVYVSSNRARNALAMGLIRSGQATYGGTVPLGNAYNTDTTTTGDHDGYAVVVILTKKVGLPRQDLVTDDPTRLISAGALRELGCASSADANPTPGQPADVLPRCGVVMAEVWS